MKTDDKLDFALLRQKAEELLKEHPSGSGLELSEADAIKLIHELEVYKVELELQQEEFSQAKDQIEDAIIRYNELSDLHNRLILHLLKKGKTLD